MSDRRPANVLLSEIKSARRRAMRHKGLSNADDIAQSVYGDVKYLRGEETDERVWLFYIKQMARLDSARRKSKADDDHQLHFHYWDDLDTPLPIERYGLDKDRHSVFLCTDLVELGDFGRPEIAIRTGQIKENFKVVTAAKATWLRAAAVIDPLLKKHPEWRWRDAVEYLRARDELPSLPRA